MLHERFIDGSSQKFCFVFVCHLMHGKLRLDLLPNVHLQQHYLGVERFDHARRKALQDQKQSGRQAYSTVFAYSRPKEARAFW